MATFWEIAVCSVNNLFSLYFVNLQYLFISSFGFKSGICLLSASVPVHCFSISFNVWSKSMLSVTKGGKMVLVAPFLTLTTKG